MRGVDRARSEIDEDVSAMLKARGGLDSGDSRGAVKEINQACSPGCGIKMKRRDEFTVGVVLPAQQTLIPIYNLRIRNAYDRLKMCHQSPGFNDFIQPVASAIPATTGAVGIAVDVIRADGIVDPDRYADQPELATP